MGIGVYLLADVIVDDAIELDTFMLGIVFLAGLYVNRAYEHFGALTDRFLPASKDRSDEDDGPKATTIREVTTPTRVTKTRSSDELCR